MKRKLPEKFFEQNQRAKTRKWKFFNLNQALWGAGNREFRTNPKQTSRYTAISPQIIDNPCILDFGCPVLRLKHDLLDLLRIEKLPDYLNDPADREFETRTGAAVNRSRFNRC